MLPPPFPGRLRLTVTAAHFRAAVTSILSGGAHCSGCVLAQAASDATSAPDISVAADIWIAAGRSHACYALSLEALALLQLFDAAVGFNPWLDANRPKYTIDDAQLQNLIASAPYRLMLDRKERTPHAV